MFAMLTIKRINVRYAHDKRIKVYRRRHFIVSASELLSRSIYRRRHFMQVTMGISSGKAELWDRVKQNKIDDKNALFKEIKIAGTIDAYQFYWEPCPAYTILLDKNRYIEIQFCPNDLKSLTDSEVRRAGREKRAEFLENSKAILELPTVQDIVKSLKVTLSDIED